MQSSAQKVQTAVPALRNTQAANNIKPKSGAAHLPANVQGAASMPAVNAAIQASVVATVAAPASDKVPASDKSLQKGDRTKNVKTMLMEWDWQ